MVELITCPEILEKSNTHLDIFLGGGITGCPDWQQEFVSLIKKEAKPYHEIRLVNPRRYDFDVSNPDMSKEQIEWEYNHLRACKAILFWFPEETLCPITLFELGAALEYRGPVIIGCHSGYKRKFDVEYQVRMRRPDLDVFDSLSSMAKYLTRF